MKLVFCPLCNDMYALRSDKWKRCKCGRSGGQYNEDGITATLGGKARVLGIPNPFLKNDPKDGKKGKIWFGEFEGDNQVFRKKSPRAHRYKHSEVMKMFVETGPNKMTKEKLLKASLEYWYQINRGTPAFEAEQIALALYEKEKK